MTALGLALASSLCWGVADFIGGLQSRRVALLTVLLICQGVGLLGLAVLIAVRGVPAPELTRLLPAAVGGLGGIVGLMAFYRALAIGTMSVVAPIAATGVAVPVVVGLAGGDRPAPLQVIGLVAASAGVVLASREQRVAGAQDEADRTSVALALVAAVGFGSFFVGMRISARYDVAWALLAARVSGVACLAVLATARGAPLTGLRPALAPLLLTGALDQGANGLFALASRHGLLSLVSVGASLYPLVTVLLARAVLGERVRRIQELGIAASLAGVVLIAAG
ncbi:MAG: DMT family transporter [Solirubrobacterales bacterium]|nr:DMT family transporter [Solirubrobacterales bacterium]